MAWEQKIAKITKRSWTDITDLWLAYIPPIPTPGAVPTSTLGDLPTLQTEAALINGNHPHDVLGNISGVRQNLVLEGLFNLHKAGNVLGGAGAHINKGIRTWSLSSGYHAAFFAAKSVLCWLGVTVLETNNRTVLLDVWSDDGLSKKTIAAQQRNIRLVGSSRVEQRHIWQLFQRMLRITKDTHLIWPQKCVQELVQVDFKDFASQRNKLLYRCEWFFDDLHKYDVTATFGNHMIGSLDNGVAISDPSNDGFSIALGLVVFRFASKMLRDLAQNSPVLQAEWNILWNWLQADCQTHYQSAYAGT